MRKFFLAVIITASAFLGGCAGVPKGITPVDNFNAKRYLGAWYEIARLEHRYEKGLRNITAHYRLRGDGGIDVLNRGYDPEKGEWRTAEGKAYFVKEPNIGYLKVSFFGPFYDSYVVFGLDEFLCWMSERRILLNHLEDASERFYHPCCFFARHKSACR